MYSWLATLLCHSGIPPHISHTGAKRLESMTRYYTCYTRQSLPRRFDSALAIEVHVKVFFHLVPGNVNLISVLQVRKCFGDFRS